MIFSSLQYFLFLPVVVFLYWRTRGTTRLWLVLLASYIFYMSWLPAYGLLLVSMTTINWLLGLAMQAARNKEQPRLLKALMAAGVLGNLGCLCYYKYANFFLSNVVFAFNKILHITGASAGIADLGWVNMNVILPLGISFFVFEFIHYIVDVYRGSGAITSWLEFGAFAAFFPSQIAGPIKRYEEFMVNLRSPMPLNWAIFGEAGTLIIQGLFKKVAIADPLSLIIANCYAPNHVLSAPDALIGSIGFVIQVYCDFSGYTDMGRGSALLLGIRLPENFAGPFLQKDIISFWRAWHVSLSSWLRDYCYIPMGGNRRGLLFSWRNSFITMVACGLWHGADWHYVIFGCTQGLGLVTNSLWKQMLKRHAGLSKAWETPVGHGLSHLLTALFVVSTYPIFRAPDMSTAMNILSSWVSTDWSCDSWTSIVKSGVLVMLVVYMLVWAVTELVKKGRSDQSDSLDGVKTVYPAPLRYASWTAALVLILAVRPTAATPFVYFQF